MKPGPKTAAETAAFDTVLRSMALRVRTGKFITLAEARKMQREQRC